jgi:hypothetical protein
MSTFSLLASSHHPASQRMVCVLSNVTSKIKHNIKMLKHVIISFLQFASDVLPCGFQHLMLQNTSCEVWGGVGM